VSTLFNYLGPLCNPAGAKFQIIGTGNEELQTKIAATLLQLPIEAAVVVRGADGMDEVSLQSETFVHHIAHGMLTQTVWTPKDFGLSTIRNDDLIVEGPEESAEAIRSILQGEKSARRDIVLANVAATLWISGHTHSLVGGVQMAAQAIDTAKAKDLIDRLAQLSHSST
jgi:anthranilate phosphoribosyltransferase